MIGLAQALCFALAGVGAATLSGMLIWGSSDLARPAVRAALIFACAWLPCFRLTPTSSGPRLIHAMGVSAGAVWAISLAAIRVFGVGHDYYASVLKRPTPFVAVVIFIASAAAGIGWAVIATRLSRPRTPVGRIVRLTGFALPLSVAGIALGAGVGFLAGSAGPAWGDAPPEALILGAVLGLLAVPAAYALIRPAESSGGRAALISLAVTLFAVISGVLWGPFLTMIIAPFVAILFSFVLRNVVI